MVYQSSAHAASGDGQIDRITATEVETRKVHKVSQNVFVQGVFSVAVHVIKVL